MGMLLYLLIHPCCHYKVCRDNSYSEVFVSWISSCRPKLLQKSRNLILVYVHFELSSNLYFIEICLDCWQLELIVRSLVAENEDTGKSCDGERRDSVMVGV